MSRSGARVIYDSHEDVPNQIRNKAWIPSLLRGLSSGVYRFLEHYCSARFAAVVTVIDEIEERFLKVNKKVVVVRNYPSLEEMPSPKPWGDKRDEVVYVGDLTRIRGVAEMVSAMRNLPFKLKLGGRFSNTELEKEVKADSAWTNVHELGFLSRAAVGEVYDKAKVGLVTLHKTPSYVDAIPVKMLEYMACGIPYIASNFGWMKKVTEKYGSGILVNPYEPAEITEAIQSLMNDQEKAQSMGVLGREAVLANFNWETEKQKLLQLYYDLLQNG
ncbi:MAG: glycosyltransferase [Flavobacteriales bacterium]|nr:glycosyltransferase [Flavobacteriales bacterium]